MATFAEREEKVLSFMEQVQEARLVKEEEDTFHNSVDYKLHLLDKNRDEAKNICLDNIFASLYKDAVPLSDEYKNANSEDLDTAFRDFMATRCPKGLEYYVKEGLKKGSPFAKRVLEAVDNLVSNEYNDKAMNIEDLDPKELVFASPTSQRRLDVIRDNLSVDQIGYAVRDNVKQTALSEITRAKENKDSIKNLEAELANDPNINTAEAVNDALLLRGYGEKKDYTPTLFEAVMINKMNKIQPKYERGELHDVYTFDALRDYGFTTESVDGKSYATMEEIAFIESVKEYTGLSLLKALKLESFNKYTIADLVYEYTQN